VGVGEARAPGGDQEVASQGEFQRAGVAVTLHRRDHGLRQVLDRIQGLGLKVPARCGLAGLNGLEVVAGGERTPAPAQNHAADLVGLGRQRVDVGAQLDEQVRTQRVQHLGTIERQYAQPVPIVPFHQCRHGRSLPES
jgi:hypothetical protein